MFFLLYGMPAPSSERQLLEALPASHYEHLRELWPSELLLEHGSTKLLLEHCSSNILFESHSNRVLNEHTIKHNPADELPILIKYTISFL